MVSLGATAAFKWIQAWKFKKEAEKSGIKISNESDLRYHVLFSTAQYRMVIELPGLEIFPDKPVRQQLMVDLLKAYIKAIHDGCKEISVLNMKGWSAEQWTVEMSTRLTAMITEAKNASRADGIPEIVEVKFSRWIAPSLDMLYSYVEMVGNSNIYSSNIARTNTLFLVVNLLLSTMMGDAERSIKSLNGDITGQTYKGRIIEAIEH